MRCSVVPCICFLSVCLQDLDNLQIQLEEVRFFDLFGYSEEEGGWLCFMCNNPEKATGTHTHTYMHAKTGTENRRNKEMSSYYLKIEALHLYKHFTVHFRSCISSNIEITRFVLLRFPLNGSHPFLSSPNRGMNNN